MSEPVNFTALLAGLTFGVSCQFESTRNYCRDYLTDRGDTWTVITISAADIERERSRLLSKKEPGQPLEASTPQSLEVLVLCRKIAELLPTAGRLLFHGSVLAYDGQGVLFTAKSGTGKSTHTRLWREVFGEHVVMVNDDKPFLELTGENVAVHGNPWRGKHGLGSNLSVPLKAICVVTRGVDNAVEKMDSRELYPMLLQQTYAPGGAQQMLLTLGLVEQLSRNVDLYKLTCNMDPQAAIVAQRGIFQE